MKTKMKVGQRQEKADRTIGFLDPQNLLLDNKIMKSKS